MKTLKRLLFALSLGITPVLAVLSGTHLYSWHMYQRFMREQPGDIGAYIEYNPALPCSNILVSAVGCENPHYVTPCSEKAFRVCFAVFPMAPPWVFTPEAAEAYRSTP